MMGSSSSKRSSKRSSRRYSQSASSSSYGHNLNYTPEVPASSSSSRSVKNQGNKKYSQIGDYYRSIDEVTAALSHAGLESSNLIVGIDVTKSNEWTGARSFNRQSLHYIGTTPNPYQQAISIIGKTLSGFDEDNLIPCYGFGDATTHDQHVFSFYPNDTFCNGFEEVLSRYREIVPHLCLAGPTSFAPIIERAMTIVEESGGQVTRSVDTNQGGLSSQEQKTIDAIVRASAYPLSIVLVGVGDGPWDTMRQFDDNIPARAFDNFQFVNFTEIMAKNLDPGRKEAEFALSALMEIPSQYKATLELGLLGRRTGKSPNKIALPPPISATNPFLNTTPKTSWSSTVAATAPPTSAASSNERESCPICLVNAKNTAFNCGHQTCHGCGQDIDKCPICRTTIAVRIKLY
ncbi:PREDICTED: E3 ubiquitin-protein ligase RGLG2-like [Camelina sativa]|uniref:E3 ubiquitin-protein ligase RGLG2-like n=1 Tax=Camelina sativa TaxID=90675 RepID=A0ABM0YD24_CAMSA|nr:PREDICTED: E3 ubiquitin-protein ligase RGLG2-like [Camelina sativa]XP_010499162.1 PREDICTED: E3 ubiquitin-protein ligase RGLG2-like [Camelina sativa]XP_010499163.1 PREDICTED: E3 ubiquitin-protein ligase RGLG2-like [Camelina sativa]